MVGGCGRVRSVYTFDMDVGVFGMDAIVVFVDGG